ncbi:MAG: PEP-CTERM sorting domain-containing protein [Azoarcus sp.]|nr:PEP-CTERM sorting domain-containing protein [Azoarcus sp.]
MNRKLGVLSVLLFAFTGTTQAASQTINFEQNGASFFSTIPLEVDYLDGAAYPIPGGYQNVAEATSSQWVAYNPDEYSPSSFTSASGELFNLDSFWLAGAWGNQTLTVTGYANGKQVGDSVPIEVSIAATEYFFPDLRGIDMFTIALGNDYVHDSSVTGDARHWALGSMTISAVPEPATCAMLLAGIGIVGAVTRRQRSKAVV